MTHAKEMGRYNNYTYIGSNKMYGMAKAQYIIMSMIVPILSH